MEKQIMLKYLYTDRIFKIKSIMGYLKLFVDSPNDKIFFNCCLNVNQYKIVDEIMYLNLLSDVDIINVETHKKNCKFIIAISLDSVLHFLELVENYKLNVMFYCNDIKMFINDNDGDFIIINTKHKKYRIINKIYKLFHKQNMANFLSEEDYG